MPPPPVRVEVTVNPRDIARITKRLDKWQGAELHKRMQKAIEGGLKLLVNPIKAQTPVFTGHLRSGVKAKALRKRPGEAAAYKVGPTSPHRHLVIRGTSRGVEANPFVDRAVQPLEGQVKAYIEEQIKRLR